MSSDEEYEVEAITQAKIVKKRKKLIWQFRVRWKGYTVDDDTWEPIESFEGSEGIVNKFWERANSGGRDYRDMNLFKAGEEFLPTGPPRRPKRVSLPAPVTLPPASPEVTSPGHHSDNASLPEKRRRTPSPQSPGEGPPAKRMRGRVSQTASTSKTPAKHANGVQFRNYAPEATTSRRKSKARRSPSIEIIPDSDEEMQQPLQIPEAPVEIAATPHREPDSLFSKSIQHLHRDGNSTATRPTPRTTANGSIPDPSPPATDRDDGEDEGPTGLDDLFGPMDEDERPSVPSHRARAANPLVKMVDGPEVTGLEGAIGVKARLLNRVRDPPSTPKVLPRQTSNRGSKPGPGRSSSGMIQKNKSSLLTFEKGALKSVKGKYAKPNTGGRAAKQHSTPQPSQDDQDIDVQFMPVDNSNSLPPPSGQELLELAGLDPTEAEKLPDFEEEVQQDTPVTQGEAESTNTTEQQPQAQSSNPQSETPMPDPQGSLTMVKDMLFPSASSFGNVASTWGRNTIFDPLTRGVDHSPDRTNDLNQSCPFSLALGPSISVPVFLTESSSPSAGAPTLDFAISRSPTGTPGKYYVADNAFSLVNTLRTGGATAKVNVSETATEQQKSRFDEFRKRLTEGALFIAILGVEVLAFCSSKNTNLAHRLNVPTGFLGGDSVLVSRVHIENYSAYADAALLADPN